MQAGHLEVLTEDGARLAASMLEPYGPALQTALLLPGIAIPRRVMTKFAIWLAERGVRTMTLDYRGIGDSRQAGGSEPVTLATWARFDVQAALRALTLAHGSPVLIGHSFGGGQIFGLMDDPPEIRRAVWIASQIADCRLWDGLSRWKLALWFRSIRVAAHLLDPVPRWLALGTQVPASVARQWADWGLTPGYFLATEPAARARYAALRAHVLAYSFTDDPIAPERAVKKLLSLATSASVEHRCLSPRDLGVRAIGHLGFFRPEIGEPLWNEVLSFITAGQTANAERP
jgi:predicted alpha/beta hydrolase